MTEPPINRGPSRTGRRRADPQRLELSGSLLIAFRKYDQSDTLRRHRDVM